MSNAKRRPNHITQPDGTVISVLPPSLWFTSAQIRVGRRFTPDERKTAEKARKAGVLWTEFADEMKAKERADKLEQEETTTRRIITEAEVRALSFFSLAQIAEQTGYADPIGAVVAGRAFDVNVDALGNVVTAAEVEQSNASEPPCNGDPRCTTHQGGAYRYAKENLECRR